MTTIAQLRRLAADCRADKEKAPIAPDVLEALLDVAEYPDILGLDESVITR